MLERFAAEQPGIRVATLRPALIFQRSAGPEIRRYFAGPFVPTPLLGRGVPPVLPLPRWFRVQGVHADDVADAYRRLVVGDARGAFNVAAEPLLEPDVLGRVLHARSVPIHPGVLRAAADAAYRLRLTPAEAGWLDMGFRAPVMDTARARSELGWTPAPAGRRRARRADRRNARGRRAGDAAAGPAGRRAGAVARAGDRRRRPQLNVSRRTVSGQPAHMSGAVLMRILATVAGGPQH